jgi:hypothetical protein
VLGSERGALLPSWETGLDNFFHDCEITWKAEEKPIAEPVCVAREWLVQPEDRGLFI